MNEGDLDKLVQADSAESQPGGLDGAIIDRGPQSPEEIRLAIAGQGHELATRAIDQSDRFFANTEAIAPSPDIMNQPEVQEAARNREEKRSKVAILAGKLKGFIDSVRQGRQPAYRQKLDRPSDTALFARDIKQSVSGATEAIGEAFNKPENSRRDERARRLEETRARLQGRYSQPEPVSPEQVVQNIPDATALNQVGEELVNQAERINTATRDAYREIPSVGNPEDDDLVDDLVAQHRRGQEAQNIADKINAIDTQIADLQQEVMGPVNEVQAIRISQQINLLQDEKKRLEGELNSPREITFPEASQVSQPNYSPEEPTAAESGVESTTIRERLHQIDALLREDQAKLLELKQSLQSETDPTKADIIEITIAATEAKVRKLQEMKIDLQSQARGPRRSSINTDFYRSGANTFGRERQTTRNPNPLGRGWNGWRS